MDSDKYKQKQKLKEKVAHIESRFGRDGERLAKEGRHLIAEGVFTKLCRKGPQPKHFFLFNDILVYGTIVVIDSKLTNQRILPLQTISVAKIASLDEILQFGWEIKTPSKSFNVYADPTSGEQFMKIMEIMECYAARQPIDSARRKSPEYESLAPTWVTDSDADTCLVCETTKFNVIVRRHHCRQCGLVVCQRCSRNKYVLPNIGPAPKRVCDRCYNALTQVVDAMLNEEPARKGYRFPTSSGLRGRIERSRTNS